MNSDLSFVYSREQALEDGMLVDVTELSKQAGFTGKVPVAFTQALWSAVATGADDAQRAIVRTVLRDAATMIWLASKHGENEVEMPMEIGGPHGEALWVFFDAAEGVTIMFPSDY